MHQLQWVKANAGTFDEACALFEAHVRERGTANNGWRWRIARLADGTVRVGPIDEGELELLAPDEAAAARAAFEVDARAAAVRWAAEETWRAQAWAGVWTHLGLEGLSAITFDQVVRADEGRVLAAVQATPTTALTPRFLETALAALRADYASLSLDAPPAFASMHSRARADRAAAFERVWQLHVDQADADLPFLRDESPYDWPAHLVGAAEGPCVHLLVDMHL
jgi:hypothetical protein